MGLAKRHDADEILRYNLAARMVAHEARTRTIQRWTGISALRIRELHRTYVRESGQSPPRHRGPPPYQVAFFLQTARRRSEATALASLCSALRVLPAHSLADVKMELPNFRRGQILLEAYEAYRSLVGQTDLTLEHLFLLVTALTQGTELTLAHCLHCGGPLVFDPRDPKHRRCPDCRREGTDGIEKAIARAAQVPTVNETDVPQQSLF